MAADGRPWEECYQHYRSYLSKRVRDTTLPHTLSRLGIAERIFEGWREDRGLPTGVPVRECFTLEGVEYLQDQLLDGDESRYDARSPHTVNSMVGAVMAFARFCHDHDWIGRVPPVRKLDADDVMKGRPITGEEFERMLTEVPKVVGEGPAESWEFALHVLWESAFRVSDLMDFSWDDELRIHPVWPRRGGHLPTLIIPATQKNRKVEEIPMLPGLRTMLEIIPDEQRTGWIVDPLPIEFQMRSQGSWFKPASDDLASLITAYGNCSIAKACGVSEQTVRKWLRKARLRRSGKVTRYGVEIPAAEVEALRAREVRRVHQVPCDGRLTKERVSRVIVKVGKQAGVVVRQEDKNTGRRKKYASAHDLRRSCAARLINAGISAETLKVVLRHRDFATTEKFYGATRKAQSAATEVYNKLVCDGSGELVGGLLGGNFGGLKLTAEQIAKLKALLEAI